MTSGLSCYPHPLTHVDTVRFAGIYRVFFGISSGKTEEIPKKYRRNGIIYRRRCTGTGVAVMVSGLKM